MGVIHMKCEEMWRKNHPNEVREWQKTYRKKHMTPIRIYIRNYYRKNKRELVEFLGNKCVICGLSPKDVNYCYGVFVIDEIKPLGIGKKKFKSLSAKDVEFAKKLFKENKIQLLCQNCSAIKTWKNNDTAFRK